MTRLIGTLRRYRTWLKFMRTCRTPFVSWGDNTWRISFLKFDRHYFYGAKEG